MLLAPASRGPLKAVPLAARLAPQAKGAGGVKKYLPIVLQCEGKILCLERFPLVPTEGRAPPAPPKVGRRRRRAKGAAKAGGV